MPDYLHRTTKSLLRSVSPNSLSEPLSNYIESPDLSAVVLGDSYYPTIYWVITGDVITLMDEATRNATDAQIASDNRDTLSDELDDVGSIDDNALVAALALAVLDEINTLRSNLSLTARTTAQLKAAIRSKLGA